jgi:phospholipase/lecithinase/hemolysin
MFRTSTSARAMVSRLLMALAVGVTLSLSSMAASAKDFVKLIVFGDSLSDNGNLYQFSNQTFPPFPYFQGRFSNGPVWIEDLAARLNACLEDHAFGGAFTDTRNYNSDIVPYVPGAPGMQTTINDYLASHKRLDPKALYVVWGGANDYLNGQTNPYVPVGNIINEVQALSARGAKSFLIPNLPDLGSLPVTLGSPFSFGLNYLTSLHNALLAASLHDLQVANPSRTFLVMDVNTLVRNIRANPGASGFTNVSDRAIFAFPFVSGYLFWDDVHPTAAGHMQISNLAVDTIESAQHGQDNDDGGD